MDIKKFETDDNLIYKYVPFTANTLKMLIKGELWFGPAVNLNDPFEGEFVVEGSDLIKDDLIEKMAVEFYTKEKGLELTMAESKAKQVKTNQSILTNDLTKYLKESLLNNFGVTCFSKDPKNILMWSHYTNSHRGLCLAFDKNELIESVRETRGFATITDIEYHQELPKVYYSYNEYGNLRIDPKQKLALRTKLNHWYYEQEIRFFDEFDKEDTRSVPFDKSSLKWILLGEKIDQDDLRTIVHLIKNYDGYSVKWAKAKKDLETQTVIFPKIDFDIFEDFLIS